MRHHTRPRRCGGFVFVVSAMLLASCGVQRDISFVVIVKSSNYAQDSEGQLTLLNYHFFSEIFLQPGGEVVSAALVRATAPTKRMEYESRGDNYYFEGGHFNSVEEADQAYPNGSYVLSLETPTLSLSEFELALEGPGGVTDIPDPIRISLWQDEEEVHPLSVDPETELVVRWSAYSNGVADPRGIVDDMIFLVLADCHGERILHTGLPFQGDYTTFRTTEMRVEAGKLRTGHTYSGFVEFPHVVDSKIEQAVPGFTSYATATYLDLQTTGQSTIESCPDAPPPMDTGQTDRMDSTAAQGNRL
ncbi:MAG: hypothetical protein HN396_12745 [Gemmatimonadales bacterium]|jgi:hypothetical protein|nr:hypothetical protein [Gemmatimonadales bacterium]MBT3497597.1 hypothetical protein [Gemmatimonadales bacterium]MBT3775678.1 hypothetical protein [Gemmatimonadales bacterium]MBT3957010.1 hypothetical protein [Gemmatimonadales bacterium]MBT4188707.1 hypothetical protein [Gemmatimonadales bacterium]